MRGRRQAPLQIPPPKSPVKVQTRSRVMPCGASPLPSGLSQGSYPPSVHPLLAAGSPSLPPLSRGTQAPTGGGGWWEEGAAIPMLLQRAPGRHPCDSHVSYPQEPWQRPLPLTDFLRVRGQVQAAPSCLKQSWPRRAAAQQVSASPGAFNTAPSQELHPG